MKFTQILFAALLAAALLGHTQTPGNAAFDFEANDCGFVPIFADYPAGSGVDDFYELQHEWAASPTGDGKTLFLSGNNHSNDLFMGYYKAIDGLTAGQRYEFQVSFRLATNVEGGMIGIGGSPGASVFVKGGVTAKQPRRTSDDLNNYRLNLDKGNQGTGGSDMLLLGNLEKEDSQHPGAYEWKDFRFTVETTANENGCVYLILGTDSGFEATSAYYLDEISVSWSK